MTRVNMMDNLEYAVNFELNVPYIVCRCVATKKYFCVNKYSQPLGFSMSTYTGHPIDEIYIQDGRKYNIETRIIYHGIPSTCNIEQLRTLMKNIEREFQWITRENYTEVKFRDISPGSYIARDMFIRRLGKYWEPFQLPPGKCEQTDRLSK